MSFTLIGLVLLLTVPAQTGTAPAQRPAPPTLAAIQARIAAGDQAGARVMLQQLVEAEPTNTRAMYGLANVCMTPQLKDYDCAIAALARLLVLRPDDPQALLSTGIAHAAKGDVETAFAFLTRARATRRIDMTQLAVNPLLEVVRNDARYRSLLPVPADFDNPFVEPTKIIREWRGENAGDGFGWIARGIGDVDRDGAEDFTTSSPTFGPAGSNQGRVYVYSSKSGRLLWKADGAAGDRLGIGIEAAGDVNRDGAGDVIAAAPGGAYAKIYDGRTGTVLFTLKAGGPSETFGRHASALGDVNGDTFPDVIVGAPGLFNAPPDFEGRAYVFSGKDGSLLYTFKGERAGDGFGSAVSGSTAGGKTTIIIGAQSGGPRKAGRAYVYSALTAAPSFTIDADDTGRGFAAMFVGVPGDFDADGVQDIYATDWNNAAKGPTTGRAYLFSGKTGKAIYTFTGETLGDGLGSTQAVTGDVDGDGTPDLLIGAWQYGGAAVSGGRAYLYSGKTGALLRQYTDRIPGDTLAFDAVGIGDVDGDGSVDLLITGGASAVNGFGSGRIFLISSGITKARGK